jgi:dienelactone hydrolase
MSQILSWIKPVIVPIYMMTDKLSHDGNARKIVLVGYSAGAQIAALLIRLI